MRILIFCILVGTCVHMGTTHRNRLYPPPPFLHPKVCCPIPDLISAEIKLKCMNSLRPVPEQELEVLNELKAVNMANDKDEHERNSTELSAELSHEEQPELSSPQPPAGQSHWHHSRRRRPHYLKPCFTSCVLNETGVMPADNLDELKLHEYLSVVLKDAPDVITVVERSFKTCATKIAEYKAQQEEHKKQHSRLHRFHGRRSRRNRHAECHPEKGYLVACVLKETFNNCPTSIWIDSNECNSWRELAKNWELPRHHWGRRGHRRRFEVQPADEHNVHNENSENNANTVNNVNNVNNSVKPIADV